MADATNTATPPADDKSGITIDQVKALIAESLKPVTEQLGQTAQTLKSLGENQKVIADTLKELPPAPAEGKEGDADQPDVKQLIADSIAAALKERDDAAGKAAARQATIDKLVAEKLGGRKELASLLKGESDEDLTASADALAKVVNLDFGGAAKNGGKTPNQGDAPKPIGVLSEGTQKFADSLEIPGK